MPQYSNEARIKFLSSVYFAVSNNPLDDVNPVNDMDSFLILKVGQMGWGVDSEVRNRSKLRFGHSYNKTLAQYAVILSINNILSELQQDNASNGEVIVAWNKIAEFPPKP